MITDETIGCERMSLPRRSLSCGSGPLSAGFGLNRDGKMDDNYTRGTEHEATAGIRTLLRYIGENPEREGLKNTPERVIRSWEEQTRGYHEDPAEILGTDFDCGRYNEMITVPRIEFYSNCEHHLLPFFGHAHVGYLPNKRKLRVVGLSKIARVVDVFARRLQIQERMTLQIADAIEQHLDASGVIVVIEARHHCMCARGVQKHQSSMVTSAIRGRFKDLTCRSEFFSLINLCK